MVRPCPTECEWYTAAATAAADPPLGIPPAFESAAHGLRTGPELNSHFDDPIANSSQLVLPTITARPTPSLSTTVALIRRMEGVEDLGLGCRARPL